MNLLARDDFQSLHQGFGLGPLVRLDVSDDNVNPLGFALVGGLEHGVGFADSRRIAQENF